MRESRLYLAFLRRNLLFILGPIILGIILSLYLFAEAKTLNRTTQSFKLAYSLDNVDTVLALTDQAVTELRLQKFGDESSQVNIYKRGPLTITIESTSESEEAAFEVLLKEAEYLNANFQVLQLHSPEVSVIEPSFLKYLITGFAGGFLLGLMISITREYFRSY